MRAEGPAKGVEKRIRCVVRGGPSEVDAIDAEARGEGEGAFSAVRCKGSIDTFDALGVGLVRSRL